MMHENSMCYKTRNEFIHFYSLDWNNNCCPAVDYYLSLLKPINYADYETVIAFNIPFYFADNF